MDAVSIVFFLFACILIFRLHVFGLVIGIGLSVSLDQESNKGNRAGLPRAHSFSSDQSC